MVNLRDLNSSTVDLSGFKCAQGMSFSEAINDTVDLHLNVTIGPSVRRLVDLYKAITKARRSPTWSDVSAAGEDEVQNFFERFLKEDYQQVTVVNPHYYEATDLVQAATSLKNLRRR